ncbi:MAG: ATP-binding cassette domain-containing protein [Methylococcaceae bacterium]
MTDVHIHIHEKIHLGAKLPTIENFALTLNTGEFVCLVGQSGCGKTTLLNSIAGLDSHFSGEIRVGNQTKNPKIGFVFQQPCLLPWRTVRENIDMVFTNQNADQILYVDNLLDLMQLTAYSNAYPKQLSEGMRRRVSIIRAFAVNPNLLLMDEPFVSLDAPMAREVRFLLQQLWQHRPHTVLFVTHDLREAIALADKLVFLTSRPMRVLREVTVSIPRENRHDIHAVENFREFLIQNYPELQPLL